MIRIGFWSMSNVIYYSYKYIEQKYPGFILLRGWMHLVSLGFVEFIRLIRLSELIGLMALAGLPGWRRQRH